MIYFTFSTKKAPSLLKGQLFPVHSFLRLWVSMPLQIARMRILLYNLFLPTQTICPAFLMIALPQVYRLAVQKEITVNQ